jgi:class 3 adenylate cyclase
MINNRTNKTSICCIVFLDIIDYSKGNDAEQLDIKNQFNRIVGAALKDVAQNDRIVLDTGDGAAITYMGSPEDALFMAMSIRDSILMSNHAGATPLYVRFGINLGPVRIVNDINEQPNIIGDGINVAQRIMSFAKPNEILVSRSYFELTSRLTDEISKLFNYSGVRQDKHVREHEVYSVKLATTHDEENQSMVMNDNEIVEAKSSFLQKVNWFYIIPSMLILIALILLLMLISEPDESRLLQDAPVTASPKTTNQKLPAAADHEYLTPSESLVDIATVKKLNADDKPAVKSNKVDYQGNDTSGSSKQVSKQEQLFEVIEVPLDQPKPVKKKKEIELQGDTQPSEAHQSKKIQAPKMVAAEPRTSVTMPLENATRKNLMSESKRHCSQAETALNQCH